MTMDEIEEYIKRYDHRLTPTLCLAIAKEAARKERKKIASEILEGTGLPMQKDVLRIVRAERDRISKEVLLNKRHACPDWDFMIIDRDCPEFECCLCFRN